ncbi:Crp/Fnr family transcriptional regulator [Mucilaginibacter lutimaris]|uniref:Crp/Fnr family transcriptional regulator n=1 Tax=Mucilaginibacter lutimaris TaxID=931629 RepID=A0ABW2ZBU0_9SPHI
MFADFEKYIRAHVELTDDEVALFRKTAVEQTLRRKGFLLQQGNICRYKIFVCKGLLRTYRTTETGSEHILQFSPENSWTTDPESYNNLTSSVYNIDALEPSEVVMWAKKDFDDLFKNLPALKAYSEDMIQRNLYRTRDRLFFNQTATAEEKYDDFVKNFPGIMARVPLHMVASFLGLSRETLSRIRHAQVKA